MLVCNPYLYLLHPEVHVQLQLMQLLQQVQLMQLLQPAQLMQLLQPVQLIQLTGSLGAGEKRGWYDGIYCLRMRLIKI